MGLGMAFSGIKPLTIVLVAALAVSGCSRQYDNQEPEYDPDEVFKPDIARLDSPNKGGSTIWDIFKPQNNDLKVSVNRYIWNASLEVLNFLPVQSVDPFTGVIVTGYGTPPGGGSAYRATVYVKDPALEARSLVVALQTRNGRPVSASTQRAVEDAILSRARQLRMADRRF